MQFLYMHITFLK